MWHTVEIPVLFLGQGRFVRDKPIKATQDVEKGFMCMYFTATSCFVRIDAPTHLEKRLGCHTHETFGFFPFESNVFQYFFDFEPGFAAEHMRYLRKSPTIENFPNVAYECTSFNCNVLQLTCFSKDSYFVLLTVDMFNVFQEIISEKTHWEIFPFTIEEEMPTPVQTPISSPRGKAVNLWTCVRANIPVSLQHRSGFKKLYDSSQDGQTIPNLIPIFNRSLNIVIIVTFQQNGVEQKLGCYIPSFSLNTTVFKRDNTYLFNQESAFVFSLVDRVFNFEFFAAREDLEQNNEEGRLYSHVINFADTVQNRFLKIGLDRKNESILSFMNDIRQVQFSSSKSYPGFFEKHNGFEDGTFEADRVEVYRVFHPHGSQK
ncbi:hypothetical protein PCE1_000343 [Barthelona sp. PCE]